MISQKDKVIEKLKEEIMRLKKEKECIEKEKERIKKEFEEYKAKHHQTVSELQKALKIKANMDIVSNPVGARKGHKGYTRHIPERIDVVKTLISKRCRHCKTKLGKTQEIRTRVVTDVKVIFKVKNILYNIHRRYCPKCKKLVEPEVPNVLPHARYSLTFMLFIMYLKLGMRMPGNKIKEFISTTCHFSIGEGEIAHILKQLAIAFGPYYANLEKIVRLARVKHTDSTSWRINGKNYFAWVFICTGVALYKIMKRNNSRAPLTVFSTKQKGRVLVIDRHSALRALAKKAGFTLQFCWSHILDDSKGLAKSFGAEGAYVHKKLKEVYASAISFKGKGNEQIVEALKAEIFTLTTRHYKHNTIRRFVNNLWKRDIECLFHFVTDPEVGPTNNLSERELRALVIIRKISNGSRSRKGANITATLLSVIQTLRRRQENVLTGLESILKNPSGY